MKALSIRQPWAQLIVEGLKDIENRSWYTRVRGEILVHAGQRFDAEAFLWLLNEWHRVGLPGAVGDFCDRWKRTRFPTGGIVGRTTLVECVSAHESPWKDAGSWGFVLTDSAPLELRPCRGRLGFFEVDA